MPDAVQGFNDTDKTTDRLATQTTLAAILDAVGGDADLTYAHVNINQSGANYVVLGAVATGKVWRLHEYTVQSEGGTATIQIGYANDDAGTSFVAVRTHYAASAADGVACGPDNSKEPYVVTPAGKSLLLYCTAQDVRGGAKVSSE